MQNGRREFLRRRDVAGLLVAALLAATVPARLSAEAGGAAGEPPPIVFVHGNGDSKAIWTTVVWRFEANGYPRHRLFAIDLERPTATAVYNVPQPGRSTAEDVKGQLGAFVRRILRLTGAPKVVLVGNSRGANTIRNYLRRGGGAAVTAKVVLGGGTNHGVVDSTVFLVGSEFNGAAPFLRRLNAGPNEVVPGVPFLTLRSDRLDKFAQPDGRYLGFPGVPTGVGFAAPALSGAANLVLPGVDHRETSFSPQAFAATWRFVTGTAPRTLEIGPWKGAALSGTVTGVVGGVLHDNVGVQGATLRVYQVSPGTGARLGGPIFAATTGPGGAWGPARVDPGAFHEFVVDVPGQPRTHVYRSPFPHSSALVTLRPALAGDASATRSTVIMVRPRGYFGIQDTVLLDGRRPAGLPRDPVPNVASLRLELPAAPQRAVRARFNGERITVRTWPAGEVTFAEFHF